MDAKLKAKAMTDDELDGVAGGYSPRDYNYPDRFRIASEEAEMLNKQHHKVLKQDDGTRFELGSRQEVDNITCREIGDLFNSKGTKNKQPTLNTYSYKFP